jgi:PAS domain S-box-containing protein
MTYVLLVDDSPEHQAYLSALLTHHGINHESAANGAAALARAQEAAPCLVLSDLQMPVMDGYTLLRRWKADAALRHIPFVVHTSTYIDRDDEHLAVELGADDFILKFVDPKELITRLTRVMARPPRENDSMPRPGDAAAASALEHYNRILFRKLHSKTEELRAAEESLAQAARERDPAHTDWSILNSLPSQVAILDSQGAILQVNDAWRQHADRTLFASPTRGEPDNFLEILDSLARVDSEYLPLAAGTRAVLAGTAATFSIEHSMCFEATRMWFETTVIPLKGLGSGAAVVTCKDITDRKYLAAKIVESESQYLLMLNATAEGIYRIDTEGRCTFCNDTALRLLGHDDPNQMLGHSTHERHHHSRADGTPHPVGDCKVYQSFRTGTSTHADDEVFFRADGSSFPVEYWADPIWDGDTVIGAVVIFMDITTRRNLQLQLIQSQKMEAVGRLAGGVAHDFNNALQLIITYGELLEERLQGDPVGFEHDQQILAAARRAAALTRQLLTFSRKQVLRPTLLNLTQVANLMEPMIRRMIGENIKLKLDASPAVGVVSADQSQIEQLLLNLAINARDAMPSGGEIEISTANTYVDVLETQEHKIVTPGLYVRLTVRDTACGMTKSTQARIFEPFFTTKEPGKGTGLGLSIVHGIVEQNGGYITVKSEIGCGTEICVYFKGVEGVPGTSKPLKQVPPTRPALRGTGTILLVEDEDALRAVLGNTLRSNGYDVLEAADGVTGLALARSYGHFIDLLLTDVILPAMSGREMADEIRMFRPGTRILYMSGYTDDIIAQHGLVNSEAILLEKPFSRTALLNKVREALNHAGSAGKGGHARS